MVAEERYPDHLAFERTQWVEGLDKGREGIPAPPIQMPADRPARPRANHEKPGHRRGDLDAARGVALGVALGAFCWIVVGAIYYFIIR